MTSQLLHLNLAIPPQVRSHHVTVLSLAPASRAPFTSSILANAIMEKYGEEYFTLEGPGSFEYHILVFGGEQDVSQEAMTEVATSCGLEIESVEASQLSCLDERLLQLIADRIIQRHFFQQGWSRVFDDLYCYHLLHQPPTACDFIDCIKVLTIIESQSTNPINTGNLGLSISFEPSIYKRTALDWDMIKGLIREKSIDQFVAEVGGDYWDKRDFLRVHVLPDCITSGIIISPPTDQLQPTPLLQANQRLGYDRWIPINDQEMRIFWERAFMIPLPPHPLSYTRISFPASQISSCYPVETTFKTFSHNFSRSSQEYARLSKTALELLCALPGLKSFSYNGNYSDTSPSTAGAKVGKLLSDPAPLTRDFFKTAKQVKEQDSPVFTPVSEAPTSTTTPIALDTKEKEKDTTTATPTKQKTTATAAATSTAATNLVGSAAAQQQQPPKRAPTQKKSSSRFNATPASSAVSLSMIDEEEEQPQQTDQATQTRPTAAPAPSPPPLLPTNTKPKSSSTTTYSTSKARTTTTTTTTTTTATPPTKKASASTKPSKNLTSTTTTAAAPAAPIKDKTSTTISQATDGKGGGDEEEEGDDAFAIKDLPTTSSATNIKRKVPSTIKKAITTATPTASKKKKTGSTKS